MNERISRILNHPYTMPAAIAAVMFGSGVGVGYILGRRQEEKEEGPEQLSLDFDDELAGIRDGFEALKERINEKAQLDEAVEVTETEDVELENVAVIDEEIFKAKAMEQELQKSIEEAQAPEPEMERREVEFADDDDWDYEEEIKKRKPEEPYILHKDEFWADEMDFPQLTLTFYEGDRILADDEDAPIYNHHDVTGILKFGHGSGDPNVVYIRNEKRRAEYEILRHSGMFSTEVLGLEIENNARARDLRHSSVKKFRPTD